MTRNEDGNITGNIPGRCPLCGSNCLEYGNSELDGDYMSYEWTCEKCGSEGFIRTLRRLYDS